MGESDFRPDEPWKFVDWDRLQDALAKLIENAEKDKKELKDAESRCLQYSDMVDDRDEEIKELKADNDRLKQLLLPYIVPSEVWDSDIKGY